MQDTIFVRPAPGRRVRDPITMTVLPDAGLDKPRNSYWLRRLRDEDVIEGPAAPAQDQPREDAAPRRAPKTTPKE